MCPLYLETNYYTFLTTLYLHAYQYAQTKKGKEFGQHLKDKQHTSIWMH